LAISYHLLENYSVAEKLLIAYRNGNKEDLSTPAAQYEESELLLYINTIIHESGDYQRALDHLDSIRSSVTDVRVWNEFKASLLLKLKKFPLAQVIYEKLIAQNPDSETYLKGFLASKELLSINFKQEDLAKNEILCKTLTDLIAKYPRSTVSALLRLEYSNPESFAAFWLEYMKRGFKKGIPSLFNSVKGLIKSNSSKAATIFETVKDNVQSLRDTNSFENSSQKEAPTVYLWSLFFLSQMYDLVHNYSKALEIIDLALDHSPTVVELLMFKARIYKVVCFYISMLVTINFQWKR
jgi:tetratricopeptide (TPR) repeat protein